MEDGVETNPSEESTPVARANPFLRFAFTPADTSVRNLVQGAFDILEERSSLQATNSPLGKRKQRDNLLANASPDKRAKKGLSFSGNGDSLSCTFLTTFSRVEKSQGLRSPTRD
jgi:hypothetical protein